MHGYDRNPQEVNQALVQSLPVHSDQLQTTPSSVPAVGTLIESATLK